MTNRPPHICIELSDGFADVYAFATLYDFLVENNFQADIGVYSRKNLSGVYSSGNLSEEFEKVIKHKLKEDAKIDSLWMRNILPDIFIKGYCDVLGSSNSICNREILIDHSILKNCVKPITEEERKALREKYKINDNLPIVVVGCPSDIDYLNENSPKIALEELVREIKGKAIIYFVGDTDKCEDFYRLDPGVRIVNAKGVLKDYYAMADASIINKNITFCPNDEMHNFIEATAGGPLFLVKPGQTRQYGYFELKKVGVIRETYKLEDLITQLKQYLENPLGESIRRARTEHLEKSRNLYLNDVLKILNRATGISNENPTSDLKANLWRKFSLLSKGKHKPRLRIFHKDTIWRPFRKEEIETVEVCKIPEDVYRGFRRKR